MSQVTGKAPGTLEAKNLAVTVNASGNTVLLTLPINRDLKTIGIHVSPTVHALDAFVIEVQFSPDAPFISLYSTSGAFTSPAGLILYASGDLTAQGSGTTGWVIMDVRGLYAVRVSASGASDGTLVDAYAGGGNA